MSSVGKNIWYGFVPVLNVLGAGIVGFILSRKNMFTIPASKGVSQLVMNVTLPALIFANFVPAFTSANISAMGPLFMLAFIYQIMGGLLALIIRETMPVPRMFHHGILIAGSVANWGNLPTAIVSAIMVNPPFNSSTDPQKGIAYISIFILVSNITFFPLGASQYALRDFKTQEGDLEEGNKNSSIDLFGYESLTDRWSRRMQHIKHIKQSIFRKSPASAAAIQQNTPCLALATTTSAELLKNGVSVSTEEEKQQQRAPTPPVISHDHLEKTESSVRSAVRAEPQEHIVPVTTASATTSTKRRLSLPDPSLVDSISLAPIDRKHDQGINDQGDHDDPCDADPSNHALWGQIDKTPAVTRAASPVLSDPHQEESSTENGIQLSEETHVHVDNEQHQEKLSADNNNNNNNNNNNTNTTSPPSPRWKRYLKRTRRIIFQFRTPATMTMIPSIIIALVGPLKALFTETTSDYDIARAPDGNPPLACILKVANFLGNVTVPLSLILLGASVGRMNIPKPISRLPLAAILALAVSRLVIMPIIGILIVQALTYHTSLIDPSNLALRFVCMLVAGSPTSVNQLVVSQIHAPDGNIDTLSAFIGVQYLGLIITTTALSAIALTLL